MVRTLLLRGMLAGLVAGLLAFGFASLFGEPQVERAIALEEQHAAAEAAHEHGEEELVSRPVQSTVGLLTGVAVYGVALGGLLALVFAFAYGRVGIASPRGLAALLAAAGFVALVLVPAIKYPGNPPAVGNPDTIVHRSQLYFLMLAISVAGLVLAASIRAQLAERLGAWNGTLAAGGVYLAIVVAAQLILPSIDEVAADFPADLLWYFRISSLGVQLVLWAGIGLVFGALAERSLARRQPHLPVLRPA